LRISIYIVLGLAVVALLPGFYVAAKSFRDERADYIRTPPTFLSLHPERTGIAGLTEVAFPSADGTALAGWYAPSQNRAAIVLIHGTGADRSSLLQETRWLSEAGFGVLALDGPGQGRSAGRTRWGVPERQAIMGAVTWLSARADVDPRRIGGFGLSMGAYVMTQAAVLDKRLTSVVLASTPSDVVQQNWLATANWGLLTQVPCYLALRLYGQSLDMMPKDVIGGIAPRPVFLLAGELDTLVPPFMSRQLFANAGGQARLWTVPGAHHSDFGQVAPDEYRSRLIDFFERTLFN
jgi:dipeptidyl aminopeptidase/acylaminoacyl peptidase